MYQPGRYAAIDIGTVTARLLVADIDSEGSLTELAKDHAICNLGVGVDKTGLLAPEAIQRVGEVVAGFVQTIDRLSDQGARPITVTANATSASRDARNSAYFVSLLAKLGVKLQVIPGEKEAALSFAGATSAFPGQKVVVIDVGGGSTEIIAGTAGSVPEHARSFDIGCRRVTERYLHGDPPDPGELSAAAAWVRESMAPYLDGLAADGYGSCRHIAVAGTATSVIAIREHMAVYDSARVHGAEATEKDLDDMLAELGSLTLSQRREIVGLDPGRAPVIVAGVLILQQVLGMTGAGSYTASERDILHGMLLDVAHS